MSSSDKLLGSLEELYDPQTCEPCHAQHYREWESSMHAYAASDPLFIAMNERGQRETNGELGKFCVQCHAPMAFALGLTQDGLNLTELTDNPNARGVTCYFCHNVAQIVDDHNRGLDLAQDMTMRGGLGSGARLEANQPATQSNPVHHSAYSPLHDTQTTQSGALCGACHDIVNDNQVALERTYAEWRAGHVGPDSEQPQSCGDCHMPRHAGKAAPNGPSRSLHRHMWPGVDIALKDDHPGSAAQRAAIDCALLDSVSLDLAPQTEAHDVFEVTVNNRAVGHAWPSGSAQDRRAWVELIAYTSDGEAFFQSGVVPRGAVVGEAEPDLRILRDRIYDAQGHEVHMFWKAAASAEHPLGYQTGLIANQASARFVYDLGKPAARVSARLLLQPVGLDVIDDFAGVELPITQRILAKDYSGSNALRMRIPTLSVAGAQSSWPPPPTAADTRQLREQCAAQHYVTLLDPAR